LNTTIESCYVAQAGFEFVFLLLHPPSSGIIGMYHHIQLEIKYFDIVKKRARQTDRQREKKEKNLIIP
jgi:ATP-dependent protease ClpP protease subunit